MVISSQHTEDILDRTGKKITNKARDEIIDQVVLPVIPKKMLDNKTKYFVNPTGKFVIGGPQSDTGMTGRKIIVDTYGGMASHGGGAFSGKDPTKVDRSACVHGALYRQEHRRLRSGRQVHDPAGVRDRRGQAGVDDGLHRRHRSKVAEKRIVELIHKHFDLTPRGIIEIAQSAPTDLSQDGRLRTFRTRPKKSSPGNTPTWPPNLAKDA